MKIFSKKKRKAIVCIHGFGKRGPKEFDILRPFLEKNGYKVYIPQLFSLKNDQDTIWENWLHKAEACINQIQSEYDEIILIGFSMGGIIASYLANKAKVTKLILLAPAYEYISLDNVIGYIFKKSDPNEISSSFKDAFRDLVDNCKNSISDISIDTLIIHCEDDEVINISSSDKLFKKLKTNKKLMIKISEGQHRMLDDEKCGKLIIANILAYLKGEF